MRGLSDGLRQPKTSTLRNSDIAILNSRIAIPTLRQALRESIRVLSHLWINAAFSKVASADNWSLHQKKLLLDSISMLIAEQGQSDPLARTWFWPRWETWLHRCAGCGGFWWAGPGVMSGAGWRNEIDDGAVYAAVGGWIGALASCKSLQLTRSFTLSFLPNLDL